MGDTDQDQKTEQPTEKRLNEYFGDWKSRKPYTRVPNPVYAISPADLRLETPDKANAYFTSQIHFPMRDDAADYGAALLASRIVGGGTGSILWKRIREKDGTSYGVGAGMAASLPSVLILLSFSIRWMRFSICSA